MRFSLILKDFTTSLVNFKNNLPLPLDGHFFKNCYVRHLKIDNALVSKTVRTCLGLVARIGLLFSFYYRFSQFSIVRATVHTGTKLLFRVVPFIVTAKISDF